MLQRLILRQSRVLVSRTRVKIGTFATSTKFDNDDYEIDLISLRKTPKKKQDATEGTGKVISAVDLLDNKPIDALDLKGYTEFTEKYFKELSVFLKFIVDSYDGKVKSFDQLTATELTNSLYIFRNYYMNGKIKEIVKNDWVPYNYMFQKLIKILLSDRKFPSLLSRELMPVAKRKQMALQLYDSGIGNFTNELRSLSREFDFTNITPEELSSEINKTLMEFNKFLSTNSKFDSEFFQVLIQINRYKTLKSIIDSHPGIDLNCLLSIIDSPDFAAINRKFEQLSGSNNRINKIFDRYESEIYFFNFAFKDKKFNDFSEIAASLYEQSITSGTLSSVSNTLIRVLLPLYSEGLLTLDRVDPFLSRSINTTVKISDSLEKNFGVSLIYNFDIHEYVDGLNVLKSFNFNKPFASLSRSEIIWSLNDVLKNFNGSSRIMSLLKGLRRNLRSFLNVTNIFEPLDDIVDKRQLQLALYNADPSLKTIDLTHLEESVPLKSQAAPLDSVYSSELKAFKNQEFGTLKFADFSPEFIKEVFEDYKQKTNTRNFQVALYEFLDSCNGDTSSLDALAESTTTYTQIPNELGLHDFYNELDVIRTDILKKAFKDCTPEEVLEGLQKRVDSILKNSSDKSVSNVTKENAFDYIRLGRRLERLFRMNGGHVEVLDALIRSQKIFDQTEQRILNSSTKKPYVQIPDGLDIHQFAKELDTLRSEDFNGSYGNTTSTDVLSLIDSRISMLESYPGNETEIYRLNLLQSRLKRLFSLNGDNTEVLDTVIHSQAVFNDFEKLKRVNNDREYLQAPENFFLEEYIVELVQLRDELKQNFRDVSTNDILNKLSEIIAKENDLDKQVNFRKLYSNIQNLFKMNNDYSFILDNIIISCEQFTKFESDNSLKHLSRKSRENSVIGDNLKLLRNYYDQLKLLFKFSAEERVSIGSLSREEFEKLLSNYKSSLNSLSYELPLDLHIIDTLKQYNRIIKDYPCFLEGLYLIQQDSEPLNPSDVEDIYKNLHEELESGARFGSKRSPEEAFKFKNSAEGFKQRLSIPFDEIHTNRFDINDFKGDTVSQSRYNDSEKLIEDLLKNHPASDSKLSSQYQDLLQSVVNKKLDGKSATKEEQELEELTAENIRKSYCSRSSSQKNNEEEEKDHLDVDKTSLEDFLRSAKKQREMAKERRFRESKAYEWSKSMNNSHRSLESSNFFNPLHSHLRRCKKDSPSEQEYLILTLDNQTILSDHNPLGKLPQEDIFEILKKFEKPELLDLQRTLKKLQKRNWRLIGSKVISGDQKHLVLARSKGRKKSAFTKLKNIFASAGLLFVTLLGLNWWLEEYPAEFKEIKPTPNYETYTEPLEKNMIIPEKVSKPSENPINDEEPKVKSSFFKRLFWSS